MDNQINEIILGLLSRHIKTLANCRENMGKRTISRTLIPHHRSNGIERVVTTSAQIEQDALTIQNRAMDIIVLLGEEMRQFNLARTSNMHGCGHHEPPRSGN